MPEQIKITPKELKCGMTVFMLSEGGVKETKIIAVNKFERFTPAEKVETTVEYFIEGKIKVEPELLFASKDELKASL